MSEYRHEYKYVCTLKQLAYVNNAVKGIMELDSNVSEEGCYIVRSLYFDDYWNSCYYDNLYGHEPREKFRIRIYNGSSSNINLELKKKQNGKIKKESCRLTYDICRRIIDGKELDFNAMDAALYRKFCLQYFTKILRPKVIVEYDRVPYVYKDGNVRVTLDKNIRSSNQYSCFLENNIFSRPIMENNRHLLEIKYDEYLPDFIYQLAENEKIKQTTFSKYFLCRKYSMGGNNNEL